MKEEKKKLAPTSAVLREYWRATLQYPYLLCTALLGIVVIQVGRVFSPLYLSKFITEVSTLAPTKESVGVLVVFLILYGLFELLSWIGHRVEMWAGIQIGPKVMKDLTERAFTHLMRHSYQFFSSSFAGALTRRVSRFGGAYDRLYDSVTLTLLPAALYMGGILIVLGTRSIILSAALAFWAAIFILVQWYLVRWQQPLRTKRAEEDSNVTAALADSISNQQTVQLFAGSNYEDTLVSQAAEKFRRALTKAWMSDWWIYGSLSLLATGINIFLLWLALIYWQRGILAVGDFVLIQIYLLRLMEQVWGIGRELRNIFTSVADAAEMVYIIDLPHGVTDKKNARPLQVQKAEIAFKDVRFGFAQNTNVLSQLNLSIAGGEKVAFVGPSGAGKSTVTKLLLRLYDVDEGQILIDGQNITDATQESLRNAIAYVPQEPILFHRSLLENIRYGRRDATDEEVLEAARKAHCHEFISALPQKYDTFVGERGVKLSGGERQRVAIARAILKDAPILILDEATSSLDSESEFLIQDALEILMRGKSVIVIAHRLSTILKMDRIIVLEDGRVVAEGNHNQLLAQDGLYKKLWSIQAGGFIPNDEEKQEDEPVEGDELAKDAPRE